LRQGNKAATGAPAAARRFGRVDAAGGQCSGRSCWRQMAADVRNPDIRALTSGQERDESV
jgi:hypothetical protein